MPKFYLLLNLIVQLEITLQAYALADDKGMFNRNLQSNCQLFRLKFPFSTLELFVIKMCLLII